MYKVAEVGMGSGLNIGDEVEIDQVFALSELFGWEARNRYTVKSNDAHEFVIEEDAGDTCHRVCCKAGREWNMTVRQGPLDNVDGQQYLKMHKNQECCIGCCGREPTPCCGDRVLEVTTPDGGLVGTAEQHPCYCCTYAFHVSVREEPKYTISGSACQPGFWCQCCSDAELEIKRDADDEVVGHVVRPALTCGEICGKTNRIEVDFPHECGADDKAALLGGAMLFDILMEIKAQRNDDNNNSGGGQ